MGDRFYAQQKNHKPKRRLKADVIKDFEKTLGVSVKGLDRLTISTLEDLMSKIAVQLIAARYHDSLERLAKR